MIIVSLISSIQFIDISICSYDYVLLEQQRAEQWKKPYNDIAHSNGISNSLHKLIVDGDKNSPPNEKRVLIRVLVSSIMVCTIEPYALMKY